MGCLAAPQGRGAWQEQPSTRRAVSPLEPAYWRPVRGWAIATISLRRQLQLPPIFRRRLAENSLEDAIEMGERLEADFVSDLADAQVRVQQQVLGLFDAHARDV